MNENRTSLSSIWCHYGTIWNFTRFSNRIRLKIPFGSFFFPWTGAQFSRSSQKRVNRSPKTHRCVRLRRTINLYCQSSCCCRNEKCITVSKMRRRRPSPKARVEYAADRRSRSGVLNVTASFIVDLKQQSRWKRANKQNQHLTIEEEQNYPRWIIKDLFEIYYSEAHIEYSWHRCCEKLRSLITRSHAAHLPSPVHHHKPCR